MSSRKIIFNNNYYYHITNYSIDKLLLFKNADDFMAFLEMIKFFNNKESLGSSVKYKKEKKRVEIVEVLAYALMKDHFHLILKQNFDNGISKFMQRVLTGYSMYYNKKYKRRGGLFVGRFRGEKIEEKELEKMIIYINLNFKVHKIKVKSFKLVSSNELLEDRYLTSQDEYLKKSKINICQKNFILKKYSVRKYKNFSGSLILDILEEKEKFLEF